MRRPTPLRALLLILLLLAIVAPARATSPMIRGYHWIDLNCDGLRDSGEPPITNVSVYLYRFGPDGLPFTGDDRQLRLVDLYISGANAGVYEDATDSAIMPAERYRLSIPQGGRPAGYLPTLYRRGGDPARWSSLQANWTTGDPNDGGFGLDPSGTVTGGNIGIAPIACLAQWQPLQLYLPLVQR